MSIHKLTAGSGYDYLTRQVAALDATDKGHTGLATYYTEKGETPGQWIGSGVAGLHTLSEGDFVSQDQMANLFGAGIHPEPEAAERLAAERGDLPLDVPQAGLLGKPYRVYAEDDLTPFRRAVQVRVEDTNIAAGRRPDWPITPAERSAIRTEVAREFFLADHGRAPMDERELLSAIAKYSRPKTTAVAGYDLTFSPVKSVSTLWAVAPQETAAVIERAHQKAVKDALAFIENNALFTRTGHNGVAQVDVDGLVATAFTHRDSRAGDPDLHTHVAVANKVRVRRDDGREQWLAIDGRVLFKATVNASEVYNTQLEAHLRADLGVDFAPREQTDGRKRPVREIVGVDPALNERWSARRAAIEERRSELAVAFQRSHGRPPTAVESVQLAQQATLETRDKKHEPRTIDQQRAQWHEQALEVCGGQAGLDQMVVRALAGQQSSPTPQIDSQWFQQTATEILTTLQEGRATWQRWHVAAEAQRRLREAGLAPAQIDAAARLLIDGVLDLSTAITRDPDPIREPEQLRRADGSSVFSVAGSDLFTSTDVLHAERDLVAAAGMSDGRRVSTEAVDIALLESHANGITLNEGQADLVRQMATSGARVQLAIAPAGTGKTTAMTSLTRAWGEDGGHVIGLAPSAAAAAQLREATGTHTDTLAKYDQLLTSEAPGSHPEWWDQVNQDALLVIDEAGMADTLTLQRVVNHALQRGASVRLVGDDQQLSAVGAGGVLRDIKAEHGAVELAQVMRFHDPAEAAASLSLREGRPEAIGFYLDRRRVHVGDMATMSEEVFAAWRADRAAGLDSVMLAPTRELVAELNGRARAARITRTGATEDRQVPLADDHHASAGDVIITRKNDRRLRVTATDFVKNGDRWEVTEAHADGSLSARHLNHRHHVRLPASYVQSHTELGWATTIHSAQGVSVDTMHGLATGEESRQQLYTMLSRGKAGNHLYLQAAGDGDPHSVIRPEVLHPQTAGELLGQMLARDESPLSATSTLREQERAAPALGAATARYRHALDIAATDVVGADALDRIERACESQVPGVTQDPAWPTLRASLALIEAGGDDAVATFTDAAGARGMEDAVDRAAVIDWRIDASGHRGVGVGPLPWVPGIPDALRAHSQWGPYLQQRAERVVSLTETVAREARSAATPPAWVTDPSMTPPAETLGAVEVWRAAMQIPEADLRPTGPTRFGHAEASHQRRLEESLAMATAPTQWRAQLEAMSPDVLRDDFAVTLQRNLSTLHQHGVDVPGLLRDVAGEGELPEEHTAAAVWWRITRHVDPAVLVHTDNAPLRTHWSQSLAQQIGPERAEELTSSPTWGAARNAIDQARRAGVPLRDLIPAEPVDWSGSLDEAEHLAWRATLLASPAADPDFEPVPEDDDPAHDTMPWTPPAPDAPTAAPATAETAAWQAHVAAFDPGDADFEPAPEDDDLPPEADPWTPPAPEAAVEAAAPAEDMAWLAMLRDLMDPPEQSDVQIEQANRHAAEYADAPANDRLAEINALAQEFFTHRFPDSWAKPYLTERFCRDMAGDPVLRPGYAPDSWTGLVTHLRAQGVTNEEMLAAGVAKESSRGTLIDRFRDRAVLPIVHEDQILGFVGRRHPDKTEQDKAGPKYLNTAETALFVKGNQLYVAGAEALDQGAVPVVVEGPMDAAAVTIAGGGRFVGVAPLGTSLTEAQADQISRLDRRVVVATDGDLAGQVAADRAYWMLSPRTPQHRIEHVTMPGGTDPADLLHDAGPDELARALNLAAPMSEHMIAERLRNLGAQEALDAAAAIAAADLSGTWQDHIGRISQGTGLGSQQVVDALATAAQQWVHDPVAVATTHTGRSNELRDRAADPATPAGDQRWVGLALQLDTRLPDSAGWSQLVAFCDAATARGDDVAQAARQSVQQRPLADASPATDLRNRLIHQLGAVRPTGAPVAPSARRPRPPMVRPEHLARRPAGPVDPENPTV